MALDDTTPDTPTPAAPATEAPASGADSGGGLDHDAVADEIAESFGWEPPSEEEEGAPEADQKRDPAAAPKGATPAVTAPLATPAAPAAPTGPAAVPPSTWRPEAQAAWATVPEPVKAEIQKREDDFAKGISMYKTHADVGTAFRDIVAPDLPQYQQAGVNIWKAAEEAWNAHAIFSFGSPQEKVQALYDIAGQVGIDLNSLAAGQIRGQDQHTTALLNRIKQLEAGLQSTASAVQNAQGAKLEAEVMEFADTKGADGQLAYPYFWEVVTNLQEIFAQNRATTLKEAYQKAIYENPLTRQKEIERLATERLKADEKTRQERIAKARKASSANMRSSAGGRATSPPGETIEDTLAATLADINSRH